MTKPVNEMNLPVISVAPVGAVAEPVPQGDIAVDDETISIGSPVNERDASCISVYAENITASGVYDDKSATCTFDIVFNVGIREGDVSKTYRVVKRIGIDKVKLACDAECSTPVSIVEEKAEARKAEAAATAKRFRILAGLE